MQHWNGYCRQTEHRSARPIFVGRRQEQEGLPGQAATTGTAQPERRRPVALWLSAAPRCHNGRCRRTGAALQRPRASRSRTLARRARCPLAAQAEGACRAAAPWPSATTQHPPLTDSELSLTTQLLPPPAARSCQPASHPLSRVQRRRRRGGDRRHAAEARRRVAGQRRCCLVFAAEPAGGERAGHGQGGQLSAGELPVAAGGLHR